MNKYQPGPDIQMNGHQMPGKCPAQTPGWASQPIVFSGPQIPGQSPVHNSRLGLVGPQNPGRTRTRAGHHL